jgi:hypothetical protein
MVDGDDGVDAANGDGDDAQASLDPSSEEDQRPSASSPLHIPSDGEISALSRVYECWISDLFAWGEII